jgi:hypothetical protein
MTLDRLRREIIRFRDGIMWRARMVIWSACRVSVTVQEARLHCLNTAEAVCVFRPAIQRCWPKGSLRYSTTTNWPVGWAQTPESRRWSDTTPPWL